MHELITSQLLFHTKVASGWSRTTLNILVLEGLLYLVAPTRSTRGYPSDVGPLTRTRVGRVPAPTRTRLTRPTRLPAGADPRVTGKRYPC